MPSPSEGDLVPVGETRSPEASQVGDPPTPHAQISEATLNNLLDVQAQELALRSKELDLRARELDNNSSQAEKILAAQVTDREAERAHVRRQSLGKIILVGIALAVLGVVIILGMVMDKDALVSDILKIVSGAVLGAFGGYGIGRNKSKREDDD